MIMLSQLTRKVSAGPFKYSNKFAALGCVSRIKILNGESRAMTTSADGQRTSFVVSHSARPLHAVEEELHSSSCVESQNNRKKKVIDHAPPRGTRDFFPEDQRVKTWLFNAWRAASSDFAFEEYDAPILESEELYVQKAGEDVLQQLYNFTDKGGRRLALRPEMTPSLARLVLARKNALSLPLKWYSIPQCWRYERMTRGRRREHYQWNMDIWGVSGVEAEAELLAAAVHFMRKLGLTAMDVGIRVNSRKILTALMHKHGIPQEHWTSVCLLLDKLDKVPLNALESKFCDMKISRNTIERLVQDTQVRSLDDFLKLLPNASTDGGAEFHSDGVRDIMRLIELAKSYGYEDWLVFDATIVRGLSYYTGIVFEGFDRGGQLRALFGGGRYDRLTQAMGGEALPAVGFGFGDAVLMELLLQRGLVPDMSLITGTQIVLMAADSASRDKAVQLATVLRAKGHSVDLVLEQKRAKWVFPRAHKIGARAVILVGPEAEIAIKDMHTGTQVDATWEGVTGVVQNIFLNK